MMADKAPTREISRSMAQLLNQFYFCSKMLENPLIKDDEMIIGHIVGLQQPCYFYLNYWLKKESDRVVKLGYGGEDVR